MNTVNIVVPLGKYLKHSPLKNDNEIHIVLYHIL
jgi:hypothetical protein